MTRSKMSTLRCWTLNRSIDTAERFLPTSWSDFTECLTLPTPLTQAKAHRYRRLDFSDDVRKVGKEHSYRCQMFKLSDVGSIVLNRNSQEGSTTQNQILEWLHDNEDGCYNDRIREDLKLASEWAKQHEQLAISVDRGIMENYFILSIHAAELMVARRDAYITKLNLSDPADNASLRGCQILSKQSRPNYLYLMFGGRLDASNTVSRSWSCSRRK